MSRHLNRLPAKNAHLHRSHVNVAYALFAAAHGEPDANVSCVNRAIGNLLGPLPTAWRVVGITPLALSMLDGTKTIKGVTRGHIKQRIDVVREMLAGPLPTLAEFEARMLGAEDRTILCGPKENNDRLTERDDIVWFDNEGDDPLFQEASLKARFGPLEKEFVHDLARRLTGEDAA
jgi:hypothetical protein